MPFKSMSLSHTGAEPAANVFKKKWQLEKVVCFIYAILSVTSAFFLNVKDYAFSNNSAQI